MRGHFWSAAQGVVLLAKRAFAILTQNTTSVKQCALIAKWIRCAFLLSITCPINYFRQHLEKEDSKCQTNSANPCFHAGGFCCGVRSAAVL
jgi:hypothetical protein